MNKPELIDTPLRKKAAIKRATVPKQRIRDDSGQIRTVYRLDAGSGDFDVLFSKAFRLSVTKARKENKRVTGSSDVGSRKK